jgi:uroporphyrinogen decarboxylase
MLSRERVIAALNLEEPDRIPIAEWVISKKVIERLNPGFSTQEFMARNLDAVATYEDAPGLPSFEHTHEQEDFIDEWGVKRKYLGQESPFPYEFPIKDEQDLANYNPPDPDKDSRFQTLQDSVWKYRGEKAIVFCLDVVLHRAEALVGMQTLFQYFMTKPNFVKEIMDMVFNYSLTLAEKALTFGADIIVDGDDYAYKSGLLMSPRHFEKFILPYLEQMVTTVTEMGGYFVKHTDGNIWRILDLLVEAGIDAINPLEPVAGMDIGQVKRKYGNKVCLIGNIDCGNLLCFGTQEDVKKAVIDTIKKAAPNGGFIMSSSNSIPLSAKPENYQALIEYTRAYGKYPLDL